jgi:quercetin dioxygenase-like cupin family protein
LGVALGRPRSRKSPDDVVWFGPNEKHWHGATPTIAMIHIAIREVLNGKAVQWMENVSDEEYQPEAKSSLQLGPLS